MIQALSNAFSKASAPPKKRGTFDLVDLILFLGLALLFDLLLMWFDLGDIGITAFCFIFYFKNVDTGISKWIMLTLGLVPFLPVTTTFVIVMYILHTRAGKKILAGAAQGAKIAAKVAPHPAVQVGAGVISAVDRNVNQGQGDLRSAVGGISDAVGGTGKGGGAGKVAAAAGSSAGARPASSAGSGGGEAPSDQLGKEQERQQSEALNPQAQAEEAPEGGPYAEGSPRVIEPTSAQPPGGGLTDKERYAKMSDQDIHNEMQESSKGYSSSAKEEADLSKQMESFRSKGQNDKADALRERHQNAQNAQKYHSNISNSHYDELRRRNPNRDPNSM